MSATGIPANPSPSTVQQLLQKMNDPDPDFRFMSLNDLHQVLTTAKPDFLHHEYNTGARTVDALLKALDDQNGEVQNLAVKWWVIALSFASLAAVANSMVIAWAP